MMLFFFLKDYYYQVVCDIIIKVLLKFVLTIIDSGDHYGTVMGWQVHKRDR